MMLQHKNIGLYLADADLIDRFRSAAVTAWDKNIVPKGATGANTADMWYETARKAVGSDKSTGYLAVRAIQSLFHAFDGITADGFAEFLICHNDSVREYHSHIDTGRKTKDPFYLLNTAFYYENSADLVEKVCFDDNAAAAAVADFLATGKPALSETTIRKLLFRESISHNQIELALRFLYYIGHLDKQKGGRGNAHIYVSNGVLELWLNDYLTSLYERFQQEDMT